MTVDVNFLVVVRQVELDMLAQRAELIRSHPGFCSSFRASNLQEALQLLEEQRQSPISYQPPLHPPDARGYGESRTSPAPSSYTDLTVFTDQCMNGHQNKMVALCLRPEVDVLCPVVLTVTWSLCVVSALLSHHAC